MVPNIGETTWYNEVIIYLFLYELYNQVIRGYNLFHNLNITHNSIAQT